jgi:subtilisin family serine protease
MRTFSNLVGWTLASLVVTGAAGFAQADPLYFDGAEVIPNRVIVKLRPQARIAGSTPSPTLAGATLMRNLDAVGVSILEVSASTEEALKSIIQELEASGMVEYAEPDYRVRIDRTPSDPRFGEQWGLHSTGQLGGTPDADIDAPEAWDIRSASVGVAVVIDTGIDYNHVDLAANLWGNPGEIPSNGVDDDGNGYVDDVHGINAITGSGDPLDDGFHGTHVSGILGAVGDNASGVTGVNWNTRIMACKFLDSSGRGTTSDAIECLDYVATMKRDHGVDIRVTNNSWGGGGFSLALRDAIEVTGDLGILFVASAGNSASDNDLLPHFPSSYALPNIVAVANTDRLDLLFPNSSFGTTSVDLGAPGSSILSTFPGNAYGLLSGTSMASPHVAGAAMLTSTQHATFDHLDVKETLESTVDPLPSLSGRVASGGRLNLFNALTCDRTEFRLTTSLQDGFDVGRSTSVVLTARLASCTVARGAVVAASFDNGDPDLALLDDGIHPDRSAGDGTYSATWIPIGLGPITLTIDALFDHQSFATSVDGTVETFTGYLFDDSVPFEWIDIRDSGTPLALSDDSFAHLPLPFPVSFYGDRYGAISVGSNGHVYFEDRYLGLANTPIPSANVYGVHRFAALFWDDLNPVAGGQVYWAVLGTAPNRKLVVHFDDVPRFPDFGNGSFEIIFHEASEDILMQYLDVGFGEPAYDRGTSATVGVQRDTEFGQQYSHNRPEVDDQMAILWTRNQGPSCASALASPGELRPSNHKFQDVVVVGVTDPEGDAIEVVITEIFQDEPLEGRGDGNSEPDAGGLETAVATLRSERSGRGDGRVYHVSFEAFDEGGQSCEATVSVCVPQGRGQGSECVDQGPLFDSITGLPAPEVIGPENGGFEFTDRFQE